jgi:hypothetical protein
LGTRLIVESEEFTVVADRVIDTCAKNTNVATDALMDWLESVVDDCSTLDTDEGKLIDTGLKALDADGTVKFWALWAIAARLFAVAATAVLLPPVRMALADWPARMFCTMVFAVLLAMVTKQLVPTLAELHRQVSGAMHSPLKLQPAVPFCPKHIGESQVEPVYPVLQRQVLGPTHWPLLEQLVVPFFPKHDGTLQFAPA